MFELATLLFCSACRQLIETTFVAVAVNDHVNGIQGHALVRPDHMRDSSRGGA